LAEHSRDWVQGGKGLLVIRGQRGNREGRKIARHNKAHYKTDGL
jgi:hypothetical protein